jgi:hypothetical protein
MGKIVTAEDRPNAFSASVSSSVAPVNQGFDTVQQDARRIPSRHAIRPLGRIERGPQGGHPRQSVSAEVAPSEECGALCRRARRSIRRLSARFGT